MLSDHGQCPNRITKTVDHASLVIQPSFCYRNESDTQLHTREISCPSLFKMNKGHKLPYKCDRPHTIMQSAECPMNYISHLKWEPRGKQFEVTVGDI